MNQNVGHLATGWIGGTLELGYGGSKIPIPKIIVQMTLGKTQGKASDLPSAPDALPHRKEEKTLKDGEIPYSIYP
ncbi:MAG: hypothetical protein NPIRA06_06750 [Nitrospirales bacterium]|nr:MAG: hypothetical protein NPIRA06_06750 [Nitrospirales bacterium]